MFVCCVVMDGYFLLLFVHPRRKRSKVDVDPKKLVLKSGVGDMTHAVAYSILLGKILRVCVCQ